MTVLGTRRFRGASAVGLLAVSALGLSACGTDEAPLGSTQWQVTSVFDASNRPHQLAESLQGRSFLVFGEDSFTGASGCISLSGDLQWNDDASEMSIGEVHSEEFGDARCVPGDEDVADRLSSVLRDGTLSVSRPSDTSLRLQRVDPDSPQWQATGSVEFISGA